MNRRGFITAGLCAVASAAIAKFVPSLQPQDEKPHEEVDVIRFENGKWVAISWADIKKGDLLRFWCPPWWPNHDDGKQRYIAQCDSYTTKCVDGTLTWGVHLADA